MRDKTRIVVVGGGFAGVYSALHLEKMASRMGSGGMSLTLVSRDNFLLFTPMLHEVASSSIATSNIVVPIRKLYRKCDFWQAEIESIDLQTKRVVTLHGSAANHHRRRLEYDYLVIALGSVTNFFGMTGVARHALTMKTIGDAITLRNYVIEMLEQAEVGPVEEQAELLSFVVAGAGFAGVELVAGLNDFVREAAVHYRHLDSEKINVCLVSSSDRILPELSEDLAEFALAKLRQRGVRVLLNTRVLDAEANAVKLHTGEQIATRTLVWTAGVTPPPLILSLPCEKDDQGRILTDEYLEVKGFPGVFALGDCAHVPDPRTGRAFPPTAQHALRQARLAARNLAASIAGGRKLPFSYTMRGQLAALGRRSGVADLMGLKFAGFPAWWLWRTIYLAKLPHLERKVRVALDWTLDLFFSRDIVELKTSCAPTISHPQDQSVRGVRTTVESRASGA